MHHPKEPVTCSICHRALPRRLCTPCSSLRPALAERIAKAQPGWQPDGFVCFEDLSRLRAQFVTDMLVTQKGELSSMETQVLGSIKKEEILARKLMREEHRKDTFGQRMADKLATLGGSWTFLISFGSFLALWIGANLLVAVFGKPGFDPYPFIFLNLMLSCLAAVQAPVIMMSQNRQDQRDRKHAESDYQVNLKAELEIRSLHEKMDHLLDHQWQYLMEIQQIQVELMEEIARRK